MAEETLPHINAAAATVVRNMDCASQRYVVLIQAMCRSAQQLVMTASANDAVDAYRLLDEIWDKADTLMHQINFEAERLGATYRADADDKICAAIFEAYRQHSKSGLIGPAAGGVGHV